MHHGLRILAATATLVLTATCAHAAVTISSAATQNMSCSGGICAPTAKTAILNAGDLENLLASGNATVTTTGTGVQANDIHIRTALGWANSSTLSLEANRSIAINATVSITGLGGLVLDTGKNLLSFGKKGNVTFANLSSQLAINGSAYTLAGDIKTLASDIAISPGGNFALANNYNASGDGTYNNSVIPTEYEGTFTGLGNTIFNLSIVGQNEENVSNGLFATLGTTGVLENIGVVDATIVAATKIHYVAAGPLAGASYGTIAFAYATGSVTIGKESSRARGERMVAPIKSYDRAAGGLVGTNAGTITNSYAKTDVSGKGAWQAGGLVGANESLIENSHASGAISTGVHGLAGGLVGGNGGIVETSYATGNVKGSNNPEPYDISQVGGLVGINDGPISSSYASGAVTAEGNYSYVGGLVGQNDVDGTIASAYSTGAVGGGETGSVVGGLIGYDGAQAGSLTDTYWDTDTSGISSLSQGAGNISNDPGITGLTTAQFQSGLPAGFDPAIWAENPNINGGMPYLLANSPPK